MARQRKAVLGVLTPMSDEQPEAKRDRHDLKVFISVLNSSAKPHQPASFSVGMIVEFDKVMDGR